MSPFRHLISKLGKQQALLELKWMKQTTSNVPLEDMINRRCKGEPLQYILGTQPFGPLDLLVKRPVLIPRPETEEWVTTLAGRLMRLAPFRPLRHIDLGTGTGCIPLLLAKLLPAGYIHAKGVDISPDAVKLAAENRSKCDLSDEVFNPVLADYTASDFPQLIEEPYHLVTANPPYISRFEYDRLPTCVKDFEDRAALLGGDDGLHFYRVIAALIGQHSLMSPDGILAVETGPTQADDVREIMHDLGGLSHTELWEDAMGKPRTVLAYNNQSQSGSPLATDRVGNGSTTPFRQD